MFNSVIVKEIQLKMIKTKSYIKKQMISRLASGNLLTKYKLVNLAKSNLNVSYALMKANQRRGDRLMYDTVKSKRAIDARLRIKVRNFIASDKNSKMLPGKRDTITKGRVKMQKRVLNNTIK